MPRRPLLIFIIALTSCVTAASQTKDTNNSSAKPANTNTTEKAPTKNARELEAERLLKEKRANAQALLINLAADARNFNDAITRARTLARVASLLWDADHDRARSLFRLAWEAAEIGDKEVFEKAKATPRATKSGPDLPYVVDVHLRREVMRLAAVRDRALGEEFLDDYKEQMRRANNGALISSVSPMGTFDPLVEQRLDVARQVMENGEIDRALQFADPVLGAISQWTVDFLSSLREKNAVAADERYARMLMNAAADPRSEANTVSILSAYLFTPHYFLAYNGEGTSMRNFPGNRTPPAVTRDLQLSFFRAATAILTRPLAPPGQEETTSGHGGHYLVIKRLLPLFEQLAPAELTAALRAQVENLGPLVSKSTRDRDDDDLVKSGIRPDNQMENYEKQMLDQLDHAKTSDERDLFLIRLAVWFAGKGDLKARDFADEVADPEMRKHTRTYTDIRLARAAVVSKNVDQMLQLVRVGEFEHVYKAWLLTQAAKLVARTDRERAASLIEQAVGEARRMSQSDVDTPRAFLGAANATFVVNRAAVWETMAEALKNSNSAEDFSGEGAELNFRLISKSGPSWVSSEPVPDFDLEGIFRNLADYDYDKTVELARGFTKPAPRAVATLAIARSVLEPKKK